MKRTLLIVEDDPGLQSQMRWCFEDVEVHVAADRDTAITLLRRFEPQVVTLDLGLPPEPGGATEGLRVLRDVLSLAPDTKVIVVTGRDEREYAVTAIGLGAADYYQKPLEAEVLRFVVDRAFRLATLEQQNQAIVLNDGTPPLPGLIASSQRMLDLCKTVRKVAPAELTTLIHGETGTGKEVLARALHDLGTRKNRPFAAINCAAIPENLLESELFGHEKGAFTGATAQRKGKVELANGGTLFLDEIGDMPLPLQAKMLRFLQERVIERIGGAGEIKVDVRVVCATHRDLQEEIRRQNFREDLYYRISEITLHVPPLRERPGDAVMLARELARKFCTEMQRPVPQFSDEAIRAIETHDWPGNVRELINRVKRGVILSENRRLDPGDLDLSIDSEPGVQRVLNLRQVREEAEREAILSALRVSDYNMAKASRLLGITRPTLYNLTDKYNIPTSDERTRIGE